MAGLSFKLVISSPKGLIPLKSLADATKKMLALLYAIDRQMSKGKVTTGWAIKSLKMESPAELLIVPLDPRRESNPEQIINNSVSGISMLIKSAKRPKYFNDIALERSRDLTRIIDNKNIDEILLTNGSQSVGLVFSIVDNVNSLVRKVQEKPIGAIEGRLDMINIHSGLEIGIYRLKDDRRIRAKFDLEKNKEMYTLAKKLLGKRIYAVGEIKRNKEGEPTEIKIEKIEKVTIDGMPNIADIYGLDPNFTDGLSVDEFLKDQRDED